MHIEDLQRRFADLRERMERFGAFFDVPAQRQRCQCNRAIPQLLRWGGGGGTQRDGLGAAGGVVNDGDLRAFWAGGGGGEEYADFATRLGLDFAFAARTGIRSELQAKFADRRAANADGRIDVQSGAAGIGKDNDMDRTGGIDRLVVEGKVGRIQ